MPANRTVGELSLSHVAVGILIAAIVGLLARHFILRPVLGPATARQVSMVLMYFLFGYLAFSIAPAGQSPPSLTSWARLRAGLIFAAVATILAVTAGL